MVKIFRIIIITIVLFFLNIPVFSNLYSDIPDNIPLKVQFLIKKAGNADTDQERLKLLRKIQEIPGLDAEFREKLDTLVTTIDKWTNDDDIRIWTPFHPLFNHRYQDSRGRSSHEAFQNSPLYPILIFYKARWAVRHTFQKGSIWRNMERREERFSKAREWFEEVNQAFPENRIARMYLGEPYPFECEYYPVPGAPLWAIYQRESIEQLTDIILWWIDNRQNEDGSYGGGWGDDVEMWRWWMPVMIAFQHPKLEQAQDRTSSGLLGLEEMRKGYTDNPRDVEHAAELTADAITPMMFLRPEDPEWKKRALRLAELMEKVWTGINQKGHLQFKSTYFSADSVVLTPPRKACATVYEARAIQPLLLYWQRTRDPEVSDLLVAWLDGWYNAAMSTERGKPQGVIPSAVHWPDGNIGGLGENWWEPENYTDNPLYDFPSTVIFTMNSLLLGWYMTDDTKYLTPIRAMAKLRLEYLKKYKGQPPSHEPEEGSREWVGSQLSMIAEVCAKYRFLTGSNEFDELLSYSGATNAYAQYRVDQDLGTVNELLRNMAWTLRNYYPAYTSEVRWTDRVLRFPAIFSEPAMYSEPIPTVSPINTQFIYSMLTGEPSSGGYFPINAVRWLTLPRDIAALVKKSGFDQFEAELFHFGQSTREMGAELYLLNKGTYSLSLIQKKTNRVLKEEKITVDGKPVRIKFDLPPRELCILKVNE